MQHNMKHIPTQSNWASNPSLPISRPTYGPQDHRVSAEVSHFEREREWRGKEREKESFLRQREHTWRAETEREEREKRRQIQLKVMLEGQICKDYSHPVLSTRP